MANLFYYVDARNERIGPVTWDVLEQLHRAGALTDETLVADEAESEWSTFRAKIEARLDKGPLPPVPTGPKAVPPPEIAPVNSPPSGNRKRGPKKQVGKIERIVIRIILWFIALMILLVAFLNSPLVNLPILHQPISKAKSLNPEKAPLAEIAKAIESMPQAHHPIPAPGGEDKGAMLLITGEGSVQVRAIPDHPGLYQVDLTRYGVVYSDLPSDPGTRNALTLILNLGTEFRDWKWTLVEARGGSVDQITKPGQSIPDEKTTESIPLEVAMWHGQFVVDFLNGEIPDPKAEEENAARYRFLEESFVREHQKREAIRAQGIRLPE